MPSMDMKLLLAFLVMFFAVNALLLRLSCRLANYAGHWSPQWAPLTIPKYRTCLVIVFCVAVLFGIITVVSELLIASWAANLFEKRTWRVLVFLAELLLVIKLFAWS